MGVMRFEPHSHTMYSNVKFCDSINKPEALIDRAVDLGLAGIAITDHSCIGGHVVANKHQDVVREKAPGFKVALGEESYLCDTREKGQYYYHQIFIAKNITGHKMLRELSSISWHEGYHDRGIFRTPILRSEVEWLIEKYGRGNVIASAACLAGRVNHNLMLMINAEVSGDENTRRKCHHAIVDYIRWMDEWFGDDFYLEVAPGRSADQLLVNKRMSSVAKAFGKKIVIGTDAHFLTKEQRFAHKAFLTAKSSSDREVDEFYEYAYLQDEDDIVANLRGTGLDYGELCTNSMDMCDKIEDYSLFHEQQVPMVPVPDYPKRHGSTGYPTLDMLYESDEPQERYWVNQCVDELDRRRLRNETYMARLEEEADIKDTVGKRIGTCMFAYPVFLQHYIDTIWECGSTVGAGRGSACAGLNHFLLGITQLDPVKEKFPFFRYMNKATEGLGDVDIDLCPSKREAIFDAIRKERGELGCVQVCTYGTVGTKSAVQIAGAGYRTTEYPNGLSSDETKYLAGLIPSERGFMWPLRDMVYGNDEKGRKPNKQFIDGVGKYPGLLDIMTLIDGVIDHVGIHASGVIFEDPDDPYAKTSYMRTPKGTLITQYSLHDLEYAGGVKMDFLVTDVQDIIVQCLTLLQEHGKIEQGLTLRQMYDKYIHPDVLPVHDEHLWDVIDSGDILKFFQFEEQTGQNTLRLLKPRTPLELANCNSVMRLMAQEKGGESPSDRYARMKSDMSQWYAEMDEYGLTEHEKKVLEKYYLTSYATPAQQEDLMMILMDDEICGFSLADGNAARKVCSKKKMDKIGALHEQVMRQAKSENLGRYVWDTCIKNQMGYSFSLKNRALVE